MPHANKPASLDWHVILNTEVLVPVYARSLQGKASALAPQFSGLSVVSNSSRMEWSRILCERDRKMAVFTPDVSGSTFFPSTVVREVLAAERS